MDFAQRPIFEHSVSGIGNLSSHVFQEVPVWKIFNSIASSGQEFCFKLPSLV